MPMAETEIERDEALSSHSSEDETRDEWLRESRRNREPKLPSRLGRHQRVPDNSAPRNARSLQRMDSFQVPQDSPSNEDIGFQHESKLVSPTGGSMWSPRGGTPPAHGSSRKPGQSGPSRQHRMQTLGSSPRSPRYTDRVRRSSGEVPQLGSAAFERRDSVDESPEVDSSGNAWRASNDWDARAPSNRRRDLDETEPYYAPRVAPPHDMPVPASSMRRTGSQEVLSLQRGRAGSVSRASSPPSSGFLHFAATLNRVDSASSSSLGGEAPARRSPRVKQHALSAADEENVSNILNIPAGASGAFALRSPPSGVGSGSLGAGRAHARTQSDMQQLRLPLTSPSKPAPRVLTERQRPYRRDRRPRHNTDSLLPRQPSPPSSVALPAAAMLPMPPKVQPFDNQQSESPGPVPPPPSSSSKGRARSRFSTSERIAVADLPREIAHDSSVQRAPMRRQQSTPASLSGADHERDGGMYSTSDSQRSDETANYPSMSSRDIGGTRPLNRFTRRKSSCAELPAMEEASSGSASSTTSHPFKGLSLTGRRSSARSPQNAFDPANIRLGTKIGQGSFGSVFMAIDFMLTGRQFAVKRLQTDPNDEERTRAHREEIRVMQDLQHENIVQYFGSAFSEGDNPTLDIYMEFVAGGSIGSLVKTYGALRDPLIAKFTLHILRGVAYLHSKGVIHRDIKGGNVLISADGTAKLADFGCSKLLNTMDPAARENTLVQIRGSLLWMAPEVAKQTRYDLPADIWSVGATVLEMASGDRPWPSAQNNIAAIYAVAQATGPPPIPDDVSMKVLDLMHMCFKIDPEERPTAEELLEHALFLDLR